MNKAEKFWDKIAGIFDKETGQFNQIYKKIVNFTNKYLKASDTVLEIGCGTGKVTVEIANRVGEINAIDISSKMIEIAKRKTDELKIGNIFFSQTTIFDERFKKGSFDVVLVFNVLHFIQDMPGFMKRMHELLKPGGFFISTTPCSGEKKKSLKKVFENLLLRLFILITLGIASLKNIKFFKISELENSVENKYFQIVESKNLHGPEEHYFIVARPVRNCA